jgi:death-on-curing family protein
LRRSKPVKFTAAYLEFLHDRGIAYSWPGTEPVGSQDCIDLNLLASAPEQPFQSGFGVDFYPTIYDKAACLFFSIAGGHIFSNGNKRTAVLALDLFLVANEIYLLISNEEMRKMAEQTASYNERGENHKDVIEKISKTIRENSVEFRAIKKVDTGLWRRMHRSKRLIRAHPLNQPDAKPIQLR